jgi:hypothetical protein
MSEWRMGLTASDALLKRRCGDCTLCCKLVPVEGLNKPANTRCRHQSRKGCAVYARLGEVSPECRLWNCQWLVDPDTRELSRPDRARYVIDVMPDFIGMQNNETGETISVPVMQVWCDPQYPDAHRDPALRRHMAHVAETRSQMTLVRYGNDWSFVICPPALSDDGQWHEHGAQRQVPGDTSWRNPMEAIHEVAQRRRLR